jgi:hypothetical protein
MSSGLECSVLKLVDQKQQRSKDPALLPSHQSVVEKVHQASTRSINVQCLQGSSKLNPRISQRTLSAAELGRSSYRTCTVIERSSASSWEQAYRLRKVRLKMVGDRRVIADNPLPAEGSRRSAV